MSNHIRKERRQVDRRSFLRASTVAAGSLAGLSARTPVTAFAAEAQRAAASSPEAATHTPLSGQFARWVVGLRYEDLPPEVVDRAKGVTLQGVTSALLGSKLARTQQTVKLMVEEEAVARNGATLMVHGTKVTKSAAAFVNADMLEAGGKWDTFRMLSHPGTSIIPAAFVAAEATGASGKEFMTGIVAGYEVMERMAADWIPTVMARGFHPSIVFGTFGAAVAAAKIMRLTENQINNTISLCVALAGSGRGLRESAAARNAMLAVLLARQRDLGGGQVLEGDGGFYWAYAGSNRGELVYSFVGDTHTTLDKLTADLGKEWFFLETLFRIYSTAGYNIAHVDVTAKLCEEHNIQYEDVEHVEAVVNWLETQYPSPAFPNRREDKDQPRPGSTRYFTAYGVVKRSFPVLSGSQDPAGTAVPDPPEVLELMKRVTIIPSHEMTLFGPRITIFTKDGKSYTKQSTGREFIWDFNEEVRRIRGVVPGLPIPAAQFNELIAACRDLDRQVRADKLVQLTLKRA